jgi:hypothetical protein
MSFLAIKLFLGGALKRLLSGLRALLGIARRHPWQFALIVALCACGWLWRGWSREEAAHLADNAKHKAELARIEQASDANLAAQIAQVKAVEAKSAAIAKESDREHSIELAAARSAADRYAARNRVRTETVYRSAPGSTAESDSPGIPADPAPEAFMVAISRDDLDRCATSYAYAVSAHKWAGEMIEKDLAVPEVGF